MPKPASLRAASGETPASAKQMTAWCWFDEFNIPCKRGRMEEVVSLIGPRIPHIKSIPPLFFRTQRSGMKNSLEIWMSALSSWQTFWTDHFLLLNLKSFLAFQMYHNLVSISCKRYFEKLFWSKSCKVSCRPSSSQGRESVLKKGLAEN